MIIYSLVLKIIEIILDLFNLLFIIRYVVYISNITYLISSHEIILYASVVIGKLGGGP